MQWGERERESEAICFPCGYRALFFRANTSSRGKRMKIRFLNAKEWSSNSRVIISLLAALALVLCSAVGARAQVITAAVRGTVSDEQGAAIAGAEVTITNVDTSFSRTAISGGDGVFTFPDLPLGPYKNLAPQSGFQKSRPKAIILHSNLSVVSYRAREVALGR